MGWILDFYSLDGQKHNSDNCLLTTSTLWGDNIKAVFTALSYPQVATKNVSGYNVGADFGERQKKSLLTVEDKMWNYFHLYIWERTIIIPWPQAVAHTRKSNKGCLSFCTSNRGLKSLRNKKFSRSLNESEVFILSSIFFLNHGICI